MCLVLIFNRAKNELAYIQYMRRNCNKKQHFKKKEQSLYCNKITISLCIIKKVFFA